MSGTSEYSARDLALMEAFGLTPDEVERDAAEAEDESVPDPLTGRVHWGLHCGSDDERMVSVSLRLPQSTLDRVTAAAARYHLTRSEFIRRRLAGV